MSLDPIDSSWPLIQSVDVGSSDLLRVYGPGTPEVLFSKATNFTQASVNVKSYGAVGDGTTDDTAAIQAAVDAVIANNYLGQVIFPAGTYKVTAPVLISSNIVLSGAGWVAIKAYHSGDVFWATGSNISDANRKLIFNLIKFDTDGVHVPTSFIRIGTSTGGSPVTNNSVNDPEIMHCAFQSTECVHAIDNNRGFGLTITGCLFTALVCTSALRLRQSAAEIPYWSYAVCVRSCDFTGITGKGIQADGGDLNVFGGIIEGCSLGGVEVGIEASYLGPRSVNFHGTYFESNTVFDVKCTNGIGNISYFGCKFVSSPGHDYTNDTTVTYHGCSTPNQAPSIVGGNITQSGCTYMSSNVGAVVAFKNDEAIFSTATPLVAVNLGRAGNVNPSNLGGGALLVACAHSTGVNTNSELFLIMLGVGSNVFIAKSIARQENGDTTTYSFSTDVNGNLEVTSSTAGDAAVYSVISSTLGTFYP